jgi:hypothetical protein
MMTVAARAPRSSRAARFTQRDVARALKGALEAGMRVAEAMVTRDGDIRLVFALGATVPSSGNPLDKEFGCDGRH